MSRKADDRPTIVDYTTDEAVIAKGRARFGIVPEVGVSIEEITPEMAADWLARKAPNRKMSERFVIDYARQMESGNWDLNGEAIVFDSNDQLADGQHRLSAIVMSGVTIRSVVVRGIKRDAFDTIDTGRGRRLKDFIDRDQYRNSAALATVAPQLMYWEREGSIVNTQGGRQKLAAQLPTVKEVLAYLEEDHHLEEIEASLSMVNHLSQRSAIRRHSRAGMVIAHVILSRINDTQADEFFSSLFKGTNLSEGEPVFALRNRMLNTAAAGDHVPMRELIATIFKAWNATRRGKTMQIVVWKSAVETFPVPE